MSSRITYPIAAAVAVVCTAILMVGGLPQPASLVVGLLSIVCISVLYLPSLLRDRADGGAQEAPGADLVTLISKMADGEKVDFSNQPPEMAKALEALSTRIELLADELSELSPRDSLTSLAKEEVFNNVLWREFNRAVRYEEPLSVALFQLRGLDAMRSGQGASAADQAIQSVSSVLLQMIRETDLGARYGDDRFAVIMPGTPADGAQEFISRFRRLLEEKTSGVLLDPRRASIWFRANSFSLSTSQ